MKDILYPFEHTIIPTVFYQKQDGFIKAVLSNKELLFQILNDMFVDNEIENPYSPADVSISDIWHKWNHIAVTVDNEKVTLYLNGEAVASSSDITIRPSDFKPFANYIGRSQFATDPMFKGNIDDFMIFNYPLNAEAIKALYNGEAVAVQEATTDNKAFSIGSLPVDKHLTINWNRPNEEAIASVYNMQGICLLNSNLS